MSRYWLMSFTVHQSDHSLGWLYRSMWEVCSATPQIKSHVLKQKNKQTTFSLQWKKSAVPLFMFHLFNAMAKSLPAILSSAMSMSSFPLTPSSLSRTHPPSYHYPVIRIFIKFYFLLVCHLELSQPEDACGYLLKIISIARSDIQSQSNMIISHPFDHLRRALLCPKILPQQLFSKL